MAIAQHSPLFGGVGKLRFLGAGEFRSDKALVKAAQSGGSEAASELVERHYPRVFSFVSYLTNRKSQAEDLTQEVFARALTSLHTFNGQYQFQPWLIKIARNLVIDEARKDLHRAAPTDPEDLPELETVQPDADRVWNSMSQQMASIQVKRALAKLPLRQRTALVLREIEEMSYAEIAQVLGTNVRGVEGTIRRAKARFRLEASAAESEEGREAVCKRTLRLVALDGETPGSEADRHLRVCADCREKSQSIMASDSLFAALPVLALAKPAWEASVLANLVGQPGAIGFKAKLQRLLGSVKDSSRAHGGGTVAQIAQAATPLAAAAVISVAGVTGFQQVRQQISPPAELSVPAFTQEFQADPEKMPVSYLDAHTSEQPAVASRTNKEKAELQVASPAPNQTLLPSVMDLLSANLPGVTIRQLPLQSQLELISELPSSALAKIAETLNLSSVPGDREALLQVIKEALSKPASVTSVPPTQSQAVTETPSAGPASAPTQSASESSDPGTS